MKVMDKIFKGKRESKILRSVFANSYERTKLLLTMIPLYALCVYKSFNPSISSIFELLITNSVFYSLFIISNEKTYKQIKNDPGEQKYLVKFFGCFSLMVLFLYLFNLAVVWITSFGDSVISDLLIKLVFTFFNKFITLPLLWLTVSIFLNVSLFYLILSKNVVEQLFDDGK